MRAPLFSFKTDYLQKSNLQSLCVISSINNYSYNIKAISIYCCIVTIYAKIKCRNFTLSLKSFSTNLKATSSEQFNTRNLPCVNSTIY